MRRFLGFLVTAGALALAGLVGYSLVTSWLNPEPLTIETVDGRAIIKASQPALIPFSQPLDNSGYDVSYPQCKGDLPEKFVGFAIVGLNGGKPFAKNKCFSKQWEWALTHDAVAIYINTADPGNESPVRYGKKIANDTLERLNKYKIKPGTPIWLDVETYNTWTSPDRSVQVLTELAIDLTAAGYPVGVYAPPAHWLEITGNANLGLPTWLALGPYTDISAGVADSKAACSQGSFGGKKPDIVQFVATVNGVTLDRNIMCGDPTGLVAPTK
ncbi:MAG: hypothetical protein RL741_1279 [Actinomycetota bacterium]